MKKLLKLVIISMLIIFSNQIIAMDDNIKPTPLSERSKVFEQYYLESQDKTDPEVFKHMKAWHEGDIKVLDKAVTCSENHEKLRRIYSLINAAFELNTMTHSKLAASYYLYSVVLSLKSEQENAVDAETDEIFEQLFKQVEQYMQDGEAPYSENDRLWILFSRDKFGLRWLPFVSKSGLASFRILNKQFGMKAPVMGVPLKRSSWDGYQDSTPAEFTHHEMRHGALMDASTDKAIAPAYALYGQLNSFVREIKTPKAQVLCDYFLFELGHELIFGMRPVGMGCEQQFGIEVDADNDKYTFVPPNDRPIIKPLLSKACGYQLSKLMELENIYQGKPLNYQWEQLKWHKLDNQLGPSQSSSEYYENVSLLRYFANSGTQVLLSLEEILTHGNYDLTKPLSVHDMVEPFIPDLFPVNFPGFIPPCLKTQDFFSYFEFSMWYKFDFGVSKYNELIDLQNYLKKHDIPFELWKDGRFYSHDIVAFYQEAHDSFMKDVVSKIENI